MAATKRHIGKGNGIFCVLLHMRKYMCIPVPIAGGVGGRNHQFPRDEDQGVEWNIVAC